jgi:DNA-binding NarL/FixJ family response regulator
MMPTFGLTRYLDKVTLLKPAGSAMTSKARIPDPIRIGLLAAEPIRVAGLASIFDLPAEKDQAQLIPVIGTLHELTAMANIEYVVVDLHSSDGSLQALESVRLTRPDIRLIVIGPEGNDELVMSSIVAGARAYIGLSAGPEIVRKAIDVVTSGSIWAPRPILSRLIDRLLKVSKVTNLSAGPQLTPREEQVLELIVKAHSTREIATQLGIEQRTVKAYIGRLMRKTGADNRIKLSMSTLGRSLLSQESAREQEAETGPILTK